MQTIISFENIQKSILDGLNESQKTAVTHREGPLLIIAGAGTGKTTVITRRIAYLIEQKLAKPSEILALTFTEKAAAEMEERVDLLVPYGYTDMWISTFNAFGDRLLRDFSLDLGLPANFRVLTATEQAIFMRQNIYAFDLDYFRPIASPLSHIDALLKHFSRLKDELIDSSTYLAYAESLKESAATEDEIIQARKTLELAKAYDRYQELMLQSGNLDFGDQIFLAHKLLSSNKKVLNDCRTRFKFVLVDEFQDTNYGQNEVVKLLAGESKNITVVGDDDQSIYRFRGASISNIMDFVKSFPEAKQVVLNNNYRSTQEILDAAYRLIQNNNPDRLEVQNQINKRLVSPKRGNRPELLYCESLSCETDKVIEKIIELKKVHNYSYSDFAILVRANAHSEPFIQSLNIAGIPYAFSGASGLFSQPEVATLIAFLKCLVYTDDALSLYQLATGDLYEISHEALAVYYTKAKRQNRTLIDVAAYSVQEKIDLDDSKTSEEQGINQSEIAKINDLISDIKKYSEKKNNSCGELLYEYLNEKGYLKKLVANPTVENEFKINNIAKFFDKISQFNHSSGDQGVLKFVENLELILEVGDDSGSAGIDPDIDAVNILTAHASKGLEWPVVFVANCVSDRFPGKNKKDPLPIPDELIKERLPEGDFHLQEERRLFYVAVTRAKEFLFLSSAEDYGGKRAKKLSRFALELLDESSSERLRHKLEPMERITRFAKIEKQIPKLPNKFTGEVLRLSRAQIDDYHSCPRKFYFAHIIKIPLLDNQYLMYGTAVHAALDHYFNRKINGEAPTLDQLITDYKAAFKNIGFITREQEEQRYSQGLLTLARFFADDQKNPTVPTAVETPFEFSENKVKINGRYDLVCGAGEDVEIKDFKTSDVKVQKDADRRIKESTQMMIYALAWYEKYAVIPRTTLLFIESGLTGSLIFKEKDLEKTKKMIFEVADGIRKGNMQAKPDSHQCKLCPYRDICSADKS